MSRKTRVGTTRIPIDFYADGTTCVGHATVYAPIYASELSHHSGAVTGNVWWKHRERFDKAISAFIQAFEEGEDQ